MEHFYFLAFYHFLFLFVAINVIQDDAEFVFKEPVTFYACAKVHNSVSCRIIPNVLSCKQ